MSHLKQFKRRFMLGFVAFVILFVNQFSYAGDFYGRDDVAIDGYDPVAYFTENKPVHGIKEIMFEYKGSVFLFATAANREKFKESPEAYVPQFNGYCAFGAASGYKAKVDPEAFSIMNGKLYLNYNAAVKTTWSKGVDSYISKAVHQWPKTEQTTFKP